MLVVVEWSVDKGGILPYLIRIRYGNNNVEHGDIYSLHPHSMRWISVDSVKSSIS